MYPKDFDVFQAIDVRGAARRGTGPKRRHGPERSVKLVQALEEIMNAKSREATSRGIRVASIVSG